MARYIKVNPKVAEYLHLTGDRNRTKDGNYLLWQADLTAFAPLHMMRETLTAIGGIALLANEAREETDGVCNREMPTPTDVRFIMPVTAEPTEPTAEDPAPGTETPEANNETETETETEADPEYETDINVDTDEYSERNQND